MRTVAANTYEASVVKRADECTTGVEWPSEKQTVSVILKYLRLTSFRLLVTACSCTKHLSRVNVSVDNVPRETVAFANATP